VPRTDDYDLAPDLAVTFRPIAVMRSPHRVHHQAPRQPGSGSPAHGRIVVRQGHQNLLRDLDGFSHVHVLFFCHHVRGYNDLVLPPRGTRKVGVLSTRAPARPNPLGLSVVELVRVERRVLHVGAHDLLDGSPILDLKPYVPAYDSHPHARVGWLAGADPAGPDHRAWWVEKGVPPPRVYRES
jgi:tRNA-Thr(GGU) m(6)t(6)A37 methyltransferase TsaA